MDAEVKGLRGLDVARGAVIAKRFEICEQLGAGGVGMVFRAIDQELEEVIALKLLLPHLAQDEAVFKRFRNEVLVARSLSHPNIVRTHDIGRAEAGYSYISMEFIDGTSLKEKIQAVRESSGRGFIFEEALGILFHIVSGVAYAHGRGVIHRDIKPANVMIGSSGEVKLADFGTARIVGADTSLTQTGQVIGTPDYMSPEQIRGEALTAACDVYSLGILAYELITAERPFVADTAVAIAFKHLHDPTPHLTERAKEVPQWFDDLVQRMTAKKREERFSSAVDLVAALVERAPSLSVQSTVFRFDPAAFRKPEGSGSHSNAGFEQQPDSPSLSGSASHPGDAEVTANHKPVPKPAPKDGRYELGTPSAPKTEGEREWRFDMGADEVPSSILPELPGGRSGMLMIAAAIILVPLLFLAVLPRVSDGAYRSVQGLIGERGEQGVFGSFLAGLSGVEPVERIVSNPPVSGGKKKGAVTAGQGVPAGDKGTAAATAPTPGSSEPTKEQLLADLGISNGASKGATEGAAAGVPPPSAETAGASGTGAAGTAPAIESGKDASASAGATAAAKDAPPPVKDTPPAAQNPPPQPPEPAPPLEPFSASLALRDGSRTSAGPFAFDRLGSIRWNAEVKGLGAGEKPAAEKEIRSEFSVNVFDLKDSRVLTKLKVDQVEPGAPGSKPAKLSGSLAQLRNAGVKAGSYRLDLVRAGEVVSSADFSVYRMQVAAGDAAASGGQHISIVTDATLPGAGAQPPVTTAGSPGAPGAGVTEGSGVNGGGSPAAVGQPPTAVAPPSTGAAQVAGPPAVTGSFPTTSAGSGSPGFGQPPGAGAAPYAGGLPPAARGKDEPVQVTSAPVGVPAGQAPGTFPGAVSPGSVSPGSVSPGTGYPGTGYPGTGPVAAAAPLRYRGTFSVSPNDQRPLTLQFTISGTKLAGTAEIGGYGQPFAVEGDVFDRGLSLTLQNGSYWIKLSSGKPERTLRGRYSSPQEQRNGAFEATRLD